MKEVSFFDIHTKKIKWSEELSIGIPAVDNDHKKLIAILNKLFTAIENELNQQVMQEIFDELEAYTHYHFNSEEKIMDDLCQDLENGNYVKRHKEQHQQFIRYIREQKKALKENKTTKESIFSTVQFLSHWLLDHIITEDLTLTQCTHTPTKQPNNFFHRLKNRFISSLSFTKKTTLLLYIPFLMILVITLMLSFGSYQEYREVKIFHKITTSLKQANQMIDLLQKERGLSVAFIASGHKHFKQELDQQRAQTSRQLRQCNAKIHELLIDQVSKRELERTLTYLHQLDSIRKKIDNGLFGLDNTIQFYTTIIDRLLHLINAANHHEKIEVLKAPLIILLYLKENYGQIRMEGVSIFESGQDPQEKIKKLFWKRETYIQAFKLLAPSDLKKEFERIEHTKESIILHKLREKFSTLTPKEINTYDAKEWFTLMSRQIERYGKLTDTIIERMKMQADATLKHTLFLIIALWLTLFVLLLITLYLTIVIKNSIIHPIESITRSMETLAKGDKYSHFEYYPKDDVMGKLFHAYDSFRRALIKIDFAQILLSIEETKSRYFSDISAIDPLTGILNRRSCDTLLKNAILSASENGKGASLLIMDLDHFKMINDSFGHDTGDKVLKKFADTVQGMIRKNDHFARIGGEEFGLLLPATSPNKARQIAEEIRKTIESIDWSEINPSIHLTVSIGIGIYKHGKTAKQIRSEADTNLYLAKKAGRNSVIG